MPRFSRIEGTNVKEVLGSETCRMSLNFDALAPSGAAKFSSIRGSRGTSGRARSWGSGPCGVSPPVGKSHGRRAKPSRCTRTEKPRASRGECSRARAAEAHASRRVLTWADGARSLVLRRMFAHELGRISPLLRVAGSEVCRAARSLPRALELLPHGMGIAALASTIRPIFSGRRRITQVVSRCR